MKLIRKTKKGFTLVELIVVIAIVAILAAISVVSYLAFINQANESADIQLVKQLNIALQADETLNDTRDTMKEMLEGMEAQGFVVENLTKTKSGYDIVWDQENNRFALLNSEDKVIYSEPSFSMNNNNLYTFWKFADTEEEASNKKYSVYLTDEFAETNVTELKVNAGLDAGNYNKLESISYTNNSSLNQSVVIRTNGGKLTVNAPLDTVKHYGGAESANIVKVASASYHEFGTVPFIQISQGRIRIEPTGDVNGIHVANVQTVAEDGTITKTPNTFSNDVVLTLNGKDVKLTRDTIGTNITNPVLVCEVQANANSDEYIWLVGDGTIENGKVYITQTNEAPDTSVKSITTTENASAAALAIANNAINTGTEENPVWTAEEAGTSAENAQVASALKGSGTEADPFLVYDYSTMQKISDFYDKGYYYFAVDMSKTDNGKIDCANWTAVDLNGAFDGKGVTLTNLDNTLFRYVDGFGANDETTIKNFDIFQCRIVKTGSNAAVVVYGSKNLTIENVNISGYIEGQGQVGTYIFYPGSGVLTFKDCTSTTTNVAIGQPAAGFVVNPYMMLSSFGGTAESKIVLNNSYFEGKLKTTSGNSTTPNGAYVYAHNVNIPVEFINNTKPELYSESSRSGFNSKYWYTSEKTYFIPAVNYASAITNADAGFGSTLTINRYNESIVKATVSLFISPNAAYNESGSYTGTYFTETLDVSNSTFTTSVVKKINVAINGSIDGYTLNQISTDKTEVSNNTLNIVNPHYGHTHNGVTIYIVQYDSDNEAVAYTSWTYISATTGSGDYRASVSYMRNGENYTAYYYGNSKESVEVIGTYIQNNYASGYNAENITIVYQQKSENKWNNI